MKPRVLIVDDSQYTVDMLREMLAEDFEVVGETGNGDEAVDLYDDLKPDVVVMDLVIAGTDGVTATERIKDHDPEATVLILTSVDNERKQREAFEAGADDYLRKPFDPDQLRESLQELAAGGADDEDDGGVDRNG
ncbi:MAG: response regulator [Halobacteriales archaeon]